MSVASPTSVRYFRATVKLKIGKLGERLRRVRRFGALSKALGGKGETILVADADRDSLAITCGVLKRGGYDPIGVTDGAEALAAFWRQADRIRAVLTDIVMPTLSGINLAKVIRRLRPQARIMAVGTRVESKFDEWRGIGVDSFVPKPCAAGELLYGVRRLLDRT